MSILIGLSMLLIPVIIGGIALFVELIKLSKKTEFVGSFITKFQRFAKTYQDDFDGKIYGWLLENSVKMQSMMGQLGTMMYRPPFASYAHTNYQLVLNVIPEMRTGQAHPHLVAALEDALIRYYGTLNDRHDSSQSRIKNPLMLIREGFSIILLLPWMILYGFGILSSNAISKASTNPFIKILSAILAIVAFISSLVTIFGGWDTTKHIFSYVGINI